MLLFKGNMSICLNPVKPSGQTSQKRSRFCRSYLREAHTLYVCFTRT